MRWVGWVWSGTPGGAVSASSSSMRSDSKSRRGAVGRRGGATQGFCGGVSLPPRQLLQRLRVSRALDRDLRRGRIDLTQILSGQLDRGSTDVLLEALQLARAGDRDDPRLLRQQPGERDLGWRGPLPRGDGAQPLDERLIRLPRLRRESRDDVAEVAGFERRAFGNLPREKALPQRAERHEADAQLFERRHHFLLRLPPPQ